MCDRFVVSKSLKRRKNKIEATEVHNLLAVLVAHRKLTQSLEYLCCGRRLGAVARVARTQHLKQAFKGAVIVTHLLRVLVPAPKWHTRVIVFRESAKALHGLCHHRGRCCLCFGRIETQLYQSRSNKRLSVALVHETRKPSARCMDVRESVRKSDGVNVFMIVWLVNWQSYSRNRYDQSLHTSVK